MNNLEKYTREQLEAKMRHMVEFIAFKLATEYIELTEPMAKQIRTPEADHENSTRVLELMVCVFPAWDVLESLHPDYKIMKEWVQKNHENTLLKPCTCTGCKTKDVVN